MKFSEIANRLTGISTPLLGVSWQPTDLEVSAARRVMTMAVTTYRYRSQRSDEPLRTRLVELGRGRTACCRKRCEHESTQGIVQAALQLQM